MANRPKHLGRRRVSVELYDRMCQRVQGTARAGTVLGYSPGYVAAALGISRQSVHQAIDYGKLTAFYIEDGRGNTVSIIIPADSLEAWKIDREQAA